MRVLLDFEMCHMKEINVASSAMVLTDVLFLQLVGNHNRILDEVHVIVAYGEFDRHLMLKLQKRWHLSFLLRLAKAGISLETLVWIDIFISFLALLFTRILHIIFVIESKNVAQIVLKRLVLLKRVLCCNGRVLSLVLIILLRELGQFGIAFDDRENLVFLDFCTGWVDLDFGDLILCECEYILVGARVVLLRVLPLIAVDRWILFVRCNLIPIIFHVGIFSHLCLAFLWIVPQGLQLQLFLELLISQLQNITICCEILLHEPVVQHVQVQEKQEKYQGRYQRRVSKHPIDRILL